MVDIIAWPASMLTPQQVRANPVPFSRSGGPSLGGNERPVKTDVGYWAIDLQNIPVHSYEQRRTWIALRQMLGGRGGFVAVPVWSFDSAPYVTGEREFAGEVPHDDLSMLDDDTEYSQGAISVVTDGVTPLGSTIIKLRIVNSAPDLAGVRFSYNHALYETGRVIDITADVWTLTVFPTVRETIPSGADLEFDMPTCLCHLADDRGMDAGLDPTMFEQRSVSFVEATDYWNDLAVGAI